MAKLYLIATIKKGSTFARHLDKNKSHITPTNWNEKEGWIIWDVHGLQDSTIDAMIDSVKIRYARFRYGPGSYKLDITFRVHEL